MSECLRVTWQVRLTETRVEEKGWSGTPPPSLHVVEEATYPECSVALRDSLNGGDLSGHSTQEQIGRLIKQTQIYEAARRMFVIQLIYVPVELANSLNMICFSHVLPITKRQRRAQDCSQ